MALRKFGEIAEDIINRHALVAGTRRYRIVEIEFYLHSPTHRDSTVHMNERQEMHGHWYVHRAGRAASAKYATFATRVGIDLTLGKSGEPFGILIRAVSDMESGRRIDGPIKVLNELFGVRAAYKMGGNYDAYFAHAARVESCGAFEKNPTLYLEPAKLKRYEISFLPRTGINQRLHPESSRLPYKAIVMQSLM